LIVIYTSEKTPEDLLKENEKYRSFMRKGRVDMFIGMHENGDLDMKNNNMA